MALYAYATEQERFTQQVRRIAFERDALHR